MSIASSADWKGLRRAAQVARLTLDALAEAVRPGVRTADLDAIAKRLFARHRARSAPAVVYGFPGTVLISLNDEIVHGVPGARRLAPGDLVKLDVTVEKDGYVADAARSVVVSPASRVAHDLVACAEAAFLAALGVARAGVRVTRSAAPSSAKCAGAGSSSWMACAGMASVAPSTKSRACPIATIRCRRMF